MTTMKARNAQGQLIDIEFTPLSAEEAAARRAAREARLPKPPLAGLDFINRLTDAEYSGIIGAAAAMLQAGDPRLARWIDMLRVNGTIRLDGADAIAAKAALVAGGLLVQARADLIFAPGQQ